MSHSHSSLCFTGVETQGEYHRISMNIIEYIRILFRCPPQKPRLMIQLLETIAASAATQSLSGGVTVELVSKPGEARPCIGKTYVVDFLKMRGECHHAESTFWNSDMIL